MRKLFVPIFVGVYAFFALECAFVSGKTLKGRLGDNPQLSEAAIVSAVFWPVTIAFAMGAS